MVGSLFETAVVAEIRKLSVTLATPPTVHHWRTHGGAEVDLVLERDGRLHPSEVKLTTKPTRGEARGIGALRETYPTLNIAPGLVICPAENSQRLGEMEHALPWDSR